MLDALVQIEELPRLLLELLRLLVNSLDNLLHRSGKDTEQAERGDG
jgi:hypothetical protein